MTSTWRTNPIIHILLFVFVSKFMRRNCLLVLANSEKSYDFLIPSVKSCQNYTAIRNFRLLYEFKGITNSQVPQLENDTKRCFKMMEYLNIFFHSFLANYEIEPQKPRNFTTKPSCSYPSYLEIPPLKRLTLFYLRN